MKHKCIPLDEARRTDYLGSLLNLTPEAFLEIHRLSHDNFPLGVFVPCWRAEAVTGRDRVTLYANWQRTDNEDFQPYFTVGTRIQLVIKTSLGREAKLSSPTVRALMAVGVRF